MAQIPYRANLSAIGFPFLAEQQGRTVIVGQYDNAYVPRFNPQGDTDVDRGIPQIYYCHNVMPTSRGFQSIALVQKGGAAVSVHFTQIFTVRDDQGNRAFLGVTQEGRNFLMLRNSTVWIETTNVGAYGMVTTAYVSGITYIYFQGVGCYKVDFGANTLVVVSLTGLAIGAVIGITKSFGYLIAWSINEIAWSSTIDPTDFTPSLTTGAGGGGVEGARGAITVVANQTLGFIVYTEENAVAAVYSGNARFPFNFREIVSSGGCYSLELVSWDANTGYHYAYTTSGLQLVSTTQTQTVFPEVTDFISGHRFEDFDPATFTFSYQNVSVMQKKLNVISDRYLVISYGVNSLTHALVYDLSQKRWGKLKCPHVDCFEYDINTITPEIPKDSIGFLQEDGHIQCVDFSVTNSASNGVMILGKLQYIRNRLLTLDEVVNEDFQSFASNFSLTDLCSVDGTNYTAYPMTLADSVGSMKRYKGRRTGINHSLCYSGPFSLVSIVANFHQNGRR